MSGIILRNPTSQFSGGIIENIKTIEDTKKAIIRIPGTNSDVVENFGKTLKEFTLKGIVTGSPGVTFLENAINNTGSIYFSSSTLSQVLIDNTLVYFSDLQWQDTGNRPLERTFTLQLIAITTGSLITPPPVTGSSVPTDYYVYLPFDEDVGITAYDIGGQNLNGTLIENTTWLTGKYNYGIHTQSVWSPPLNSYCDVPDDGNAFVLKSADSKTIIFWINADVDFGNNQGDGTICGQYDGYVSAGYVNGFYIGVGDFNGSDGTFLPSLWIGDGTLNNFITLDFSYIHRETWNQIGFIWNRSTNLCNLIINGNILPYDADISIFTTLATQGIWLGYGLNGFQSQYFFKGSFDDLRVYNYALSQADVTALYNL